MRRHLFSIKLVLDAYVGSGWLPVIPGLDRASKPWDRGRETPGKSKELGDGQMQGQILKVKSWKQAQVVLCNSTCDFAALRLKLEMKGSNEGLWVMTECLCHWQ